MTAEVEALVGMCAALAARDEDALDRALRAAAEVADRARTEEALLQSYLFLGYPIALNGFAQWRALCGPGDALLDPAAPSEWAERGVEVCGTVYGGQYAALRVNVRALHPELEAWMVTEGYGKVLGRAGLPLPLRELCIVAILVVIETPRQLYSHLRGALNAGAGAEDIERTLELAGTFAGDRGATKAWEVWQRVSGRTTSE